MLQIPKGQGRYSTGLANMWMNFCFSDLLTKSRLNVKLYK